MFVNIQCVNIATNIVVEPLVLLLRISKVLGSNLGLKTAFMVEGVSGFSQSFKENTDLVLQISSSTLPYTSS
jgi:hypothetical protein